LKYLSPTELWSIRRRRKNKRADQQLKQANQDHVPGALVYTGDASEVPINLQLIEFSADTYREETLQPDQIGSLKNNKDTIWLNVTGLHKTEIIRQLGRTFDIHELALEDILNIAQRPAFEPYDHFFFIAAKMLKINGQALISEQFSMVVGNGFIITFQEREGDVFDSIRKRLKNKSGFIRTRGADYLAFALLDVIVDHYMEIVDLYGDEINDQEVQLLERTDKSMLSELNLSKKELNYLRRYARPLRDVVIAFLKSDLSFIEKKTRPFLNDLMGHINQVTDNIEVYRDSINDNLGTYHLTMSNKLNDILKVLTIFSVIFIPLTFLAGIYGMNFDHMPELHYAYSYPIFIGVLVAVAVGMILIFKKRGWL